MRPTPGIIPTHKGNPTVTKYVGATMFVDHSFDFTYVHLMSKLNAEAKVEANLEFERICYSYGVKSLRYHADNGLFDTNKFKEACNVSKRTLSFCGVNDHHQNGKPENIVKDVTTGESTALKFMLPFGLVL